jgi:hypothetical protein
MPEYLYCVYLGPGNTALLGQAEVRTRGPKLVRLKEPLLAFGFRSQFDVGEARNMASPRKAWERFRDNREQSRKYHLRLADIDHDAWSQANRELDKLAAEGQ